MRFACLAFLLVTGACARAALIDPDGGALDADAATGGSSGGDGSVDASGTSNTTGGMPTAGTNTSTGGDDAGATGSMDAGATAGASSGGDDGAATTASSAGDAGTCGDTDTDTDLANCGACGNVCPASASSCASGLCQFGFTCTWYSYNQDDYLFCNSQTGQNWAAARTFCQALKMDLAVIETSEEDAFIASHSIDHWIGASDLDAEGSWRWIVPGGATLGSLFWQGVANGTAQGGAFTHWSVTEPNPYPGTQNCGGMLSGAWWDEDCTRDKGLVCEVVRPTH